MVAGGQRLVHTSFVPPGSCSPCAPLLWNQGFLTPLGELSISTNLVKAPVIRLSSSQFHKQQPRCINAGGSTGDGINARIVKARAVYANLGHLWSLCDVSLAVKVRIYNASVRAVLFYACETWPLQVEDVGRLFVFDHRCLRRIADIQWQHHVSNAEVRHRVFGHRDDNAIGVTILEHRLRWLGHVLRMSSQRIPRRALFVASGTDWKKRRGGQYMTWCERKLQRTGFCWSFTTPWLGSERWYNTVARDVIR
ncbi:unnamed protein product [Schistosoma mattheei]|uniref:Uncharacterized protein n=1 Tax=Schistosoma mattheei TaxID=31246 RepID=A0A183Q486_9TREM|nr:unnamed protein product [Schistosoma mattheei]